MRLALPFITVVRSITRNFLVHQAAAAAVVFAVVNQLDIRRLEQRHCITVEGFVRIGGAVEIAIGQAFQLMPALSVS